MPDQPHTPRAPRASLEAAFRYRWKSFIDFVETQSINISETGMFVTCKEPLSIGTLIDFEFALLDGFPLLKGKAEVTRVNTTPPTGMGVKFRELDEDSKTLLERIVAINKEERKKPSVAPDLVDPKQVKPAPPATVRPAVPPAPSAPPRPGVHAAAPPSSAASKPANVHTKPTTGGGTSVPSSGGPLAGATVASAGLEMTDRAIKVQINPVTVGYFTNNPLLNIRLGGFVVPGQRDAALGTIFELTINGLSGQTLLTGKGKVVAKHESRLGIRMVDADKNMIAALQKEIAKYGTGK